VNTGKKSKEECTQLTLRRKSGIHEDFAVKLVRFIKTTNRKTLK
jgi:hypothetical protein